MRRQQSLQFAFEWFRFHEDISAVVMQKRTDKAGSKTELGRLSGHPYVKKEDVLPNNSRVQDVEISQKVSHNGTRKLLLNAARTTELVEDGQWANILYGALKAGRAN